MIGQLVLSAGGTVLEHVLTVLELVWTWLFLFVMSVVAPVLGRVVKAVVHEVALFPSPAFLPLVWHYCQTCYGVCPCAHCGFCLLSPGNYPSPHSQRMPIQVSVGLDNLLETCIRSHHSML